MQPEQAVIFAPIIIFFLIFISLIIGFLLVVVKLVLKAKKSAWQGIVVDKIYKSNRDFDTNYIKHYYTIVFEVAKGKTIKVGVDKKTYDNYQIGDKAEKKSGELWPKKIS
jgi:nitrogen fixation protein FixH